MQHYQTNDRKRSLQYLEIWLTEWKVKRKLLFHSEMKLDISDIFTALGDAAGTTTHRAELRQRSRIFSEFRPSWLESLYWDMKKEIMNGKSAAAALWNIKCGFARKLENMMETLVLGISTTGCLIVYPSLVEIEFRFLRFSQIHSDSLRFT